MDEAMNAYLGSAWYGTEDDGLYDEITLQQSKDRQRAKILREEYDAWLLEWTGQLTFSAFILDRIAELEN